MDQWNLHKQKWMWDNGMKRSQTISIDFADNDSYIRWEILL